MSKTATAQRRLLALRPLVGDQYLVNMKMLAEELFDENNPTSIEDCLSGTVVLKLRQLAARIEAEALAGEVDGVDGGQTRESEEGCGYRRNSAGGTHKIELAVEMLRGHLCLSDKSREVSLGTSKDQSGGVVPIVLDVESEATVSAERDERCNAPTFWAIVDEGQRAAFRTIIDHLVDEPSRKLVDCRREQAAPSVGNAINSDSTDCHISSPVVATSGADTSDVPALTVQEGGSSGAAPGLEGVSPAPSTPRFVAVGEYVYDRDLHRFSNAVAPTYRARLFNEGSFNPDLFTWEEGA